MTIKGTSTNTTLYVKGDIVVGGNNCAIRQEGKTVLTGDFVNNVSGANKHVFTDRSGVLEFRGTTAAQHIRGSADKATNYINFPNTVIVSNTNTNYSNDSAVVVLSPLMGATIKNMDLQKGRFVLDSKVSGDKADIAHLLVETGGTINYNSAATPKHAAGIIQVNLAMGNNADAGHMVGFSSPFQTMYADYFFFNFMAEPKSDMFFNGENDPWNLDPTLTLQPGRGYVIGQGIVRHEAPHNQPGGYYDISLNPTYSTADYTKVAKERFSFARPFMPSSFSTWNPATEERLNITDVSVSLTEGFNYLGNPFTVPLDMTSFLNSNLTDWGISATDIEQPTIYILRPRSKGSYNGLFSFDTGYQVMQLVGSTTDPKAEEQAIIAPMQMFVIKGTPSAAGKDFSIKASKRTHGKTQFLRSEANAPIDELLIETKDVLTEGYDRLCVVFRNTATLRSNDMYDAEKLFNKTKGVNQIYTRSSENVDLTTNVIPATTERLQMYFEPSSIEQQVNLTASRIESLQSVKSVILEDTKTGGMIDLLLKPTYLFTSSPTDDTKRFILHFNTMPTSVEDIQSNSILCASYTNGVIDLRGLRQEDIGKDVLVYTVQGQLVAKQKTSDVVCSIYKSLPSGIYILKVEGNQDAIKLSVK